MPYSSPIESGLATAVYMRRIVEHSPPNAVDTLATGQCLAYVFAVTDSGDANIPLEPPLLSWGSNTRVVRWESRDSSGDLFMVLAGYGTNDRR